MFSTIIALIIMFFIGRAVLKWARAESQNEAEAIKEIIEYIKEGKEVEEDGASESEDEG